MAFKDGLLPEFDNEMANTRKTLERVPNDKFGWKPHDKSFSMGDLASHIANLPDWFIHTIGKDSLDIAPTDGTKMTTPKAKSAKELLSIFDANAKAARKAIESASDEEFAKPWSLLAGGKTIFTMPKRAVLRSFVMNHLIHHRAQLGVYLRLNDVPVPALYGPSADETAF
jgi:uncharacterized damage-inducible protein DinB